MYVQPQLLRPGNFGMLKNMDSSCYNSLVFPDEATVLDPLFCFNRYAERKNCFPCNTEAEEAKGLVPEEPREENRMHKHPGIRVATVTKVSLNFVPCLIVCWSWCLVNWSHHQLTSENANSATMSVCRCVRVLPPTFGRSIFGHLEVHAWNK